MSMRHFIDLMEAQIERVDLDGTEVRVWVNPTHGQFMRLFQIVASTLRGSTDAAGNLYVWDAAIAIHVQIERALEIDATERMMLRSHVVSLEYDVDEERFRAIPGIARAYGNSDYDIENDSALPDDEDDNDLFEESMTDDFLYHSTNAPLASLRQDGLRASEWEDEEIEEQIGPGIHYLLFYTHSPQTEYGETLLRFRRSAISVADAYSPDRGEFFHSPEPFAVPPRQLEMLVGDRWRRLRR